MTFFAASVKAAKRKSRLKVICDREQCQWLTGLGFFKKKSSLNVTLDEVDSCYA
jgi:hypothetical protein